MHKLLRYFFEILIIIEMLEEIIEFMLFFKFPRTFKNVYHFNKNVKAPNYFEVFQLTFFNLF